ncbi:hypothetical protein [Nitrosopumilus sp.]|uniref:hypothetical protein n=1 Tax=Nitrosopumilus sp. TaxID=2024843 RepID=UPI00292D522B|nr:hypothetical protein [Nitrosopumilus sp.]
MMNANQTLEIQTNGGSRCFCSKPKLITTSQEAEIICKSCGVSFGYDNFQDIENTIPYYHVTKIKLNSFQSRQTGSNPNDTKKITHVKLRVSKTNQDMRCFFDICDKLHLTSTVSEECWNNYVQLKKDHLTRAQSTCLVIYQTCRFYRIPFSEEKIKNVVCQSLGVKNAPHLKNIIFKAGKKEEFKTTQEGKDAFYLNLHLSQAQKDHKIQDVSVLRRIASRYYENLINPHSSSICLNENQSPLVMRNNADYDIMAKRSVLLAVQRCLCN